jgi:hypothetical protein
VNRSPYTPARHPGRRGLWSAEAILDALRRWTLEHGEPPRRRDWSGEHPAGAGAGQRRWMREHPRWPSASCVARHFGTWGAALEEAGLPARRLDFPSTPAERVAEARRLAGAGLARADIADQLGVSLASVHNYLNARRCPVCDGPVTNPLANACRECTRSLPTIPRSWTREEARRAIADWIAAHGGPPTYRDWTPSRSSLGAWQAESPRWPSAAVVAALWADEPNPWRSALRDAA